MTEEKRCTDHLNAAVALIQDDECATVPLSPHGPVFLSIGKVGARHFEVLLKVVDSGGVRIAAAVAIENLVGTVVSESGRCKARVLRSSAGRLDVYVNPGQHVRFTRA